MPSLLYFTSTCLALAVCLPACGSRAPSDETSSTGSGTSSEASEGESDNDSTPESSNATFTSAEETTGEEGETGEVPNCGDESCTPDEYCDWGLNLCGEVEYDEGTCKPKPEGCDDFWDPVCACDGQVYGNECEASGAGIDIDAQGECVQPEGTFACGPRFCMLDETYCQLGISDVQGEPDWWGCMPVPSSCGGTPDCDCLADEICGDLCEPTDDDGYLLVCPGG